MMEKGEHNALLRNIKEEQNKVYTQNGAQALMSTNNGLTDLFGVIGAARNMDKNRLERLFINALHEDKLLATKMLFYARDVRSGGLGEREVFRTLYKYLANNHMNIARKNLKHIPEFGRWDDVYCLINTPIEKDMWRLITRQFKKDLWNYKNNNPISLMAKWLPSTNSKNKDIRILGEKTANVLGMNVSKYRKTISKLRKYIEVTESKISDNKWQEVEYGNVPSLAMNRYRNAFRRHDEERFERFLDNVAAGKDKINSSTLYPYNILERYGIDCWGDYHLQTCSGYDRALEEQWKSLPNYVEGENNILVMADTSGSMSGRPLNTSVGLAIYFAERNKGEFRNTFMTFSGEPTLVQLKGESLYEKMRSVPSIVSNTDIGKAFNLILKTAVRGNVPKEDMPKTLIIISDMEFDEIHEGRGIWSDDPVEWDFYSEMKVKFEESGYDIPNIVFWNVDSKTSVYHAMSGYDGVQLASGQSVSVFKQILENMDKTPYEAMISVLTRTVYDCITL